MLNLTDTAIRLYRQLFGSPELAGQLHDGLQTVLDGNTAIAITEAGITEVAAMGGSFLQQGAPLTWLAEQQRLTKNFFGEALSVQQADSPRGALASAMGVSLSGHRSTVFLNAQDLSACQDLLSTAAGRHLPLVIHLHNSVCTMQASSIASGHEVIHQIMDSGCIVLVAENVQQAVDFTLIARHVAEISLTPAVVVMDAAETALSAQDVCLPSAELVKQFVGRADALIDNPSNAQKQVFATSSSQPQRRRVPKWHDLDNPVLQGALQSAKTFALGQAASAVYFATLVQPTIQQAFSHYAQLTARHYSALSADSLRNADVLLLAQGSAVETVKTLQQYLTTVDKKQLPEDLEKVKLGIIGIHALRPFDASALLKLLAKNNCAAKPLVVLERMQVSLAEDAPLMREIRAALQAKTQSVAPITPLHSVIYGIGGSELNPADLWHLVSAVKKKTTIGRYLGIPFISYDVDNAPSKTKEYHPKRQVMLDTLERYYPQINGLGINSKGLLLSPGSSQNHALSFAVSYINSEEVSCSYSMDLAAYLYKLSGGYIRHQTSAGWRQWAQRNTDILVHSNNAYTADQATQLDYFMLLSADADSLLTACQKLNNKAVLIFTLTKPLSTHSAHLRDKCQALINDKQLSLYQLSDEHSSIALYWEQMLAMLVALLLKRDYINIKTRKIISLRDALFNDRDEVDTEKTIEVFKTTLNAALENPVRVLSEEHLGLLFGQKNTNNCTSMVPEIVRKFEQITETYADLPRFWDQVGVLYQQGEQSQLTADPYLATGTIPSLSAAFNDMSQYRQDNGLPQFNPQTCTACGECWSSCPESAIASVALTPRALLETAIKLSAADGLRAIASQLAGHIARRCRNNELQFSTSGELLDDAFAQFQQKSSMPEQRMQTLQTDFAKARAAVADLPLVASDLLFYDAEQQQNDSGELLSLVINPDSCKSCGLCIQRCAEQFTDDDNELTAALTVAVADEESLIVPSLEGLYQKQWQIWQQTPDTASATIEHLLQQQAMPAGSALMLSRYNAFSLSGGDHAEPASGEKIAMRQLLSATEYHQQPLLYRFTQELEHLGNELRAEINHHLSSALPTDNLNHLEAKLADINTRQTDLNSLLEQSTQVMDSTAIDALRVHQLVTLLIAINDLHWQLSAGRYGIGRARYSLSITSSSIAAWAGDFPYNPFHVPVNIDVSGESVQFAAGLIQGQVKELLAAVSLMRQARASIDSRYAKQVDKLTGLYWQDLSDDEQQLCPPLFLVGGDDLLAAHGFAQIALLLNDLYPIKIVVFSELDNGLGQRPQASYQLNRRHDSANNLAMMAMAQQHAYVAQTSIADNNHFQQSVEQLLDNNRPGLLCIHTPSPQRHGFAPEQTLRQAELAVYSGMFPLFQYNPRDEGVFGSRLSLHESVVCKGPEIADDNALNPVHWAINEQRFGAHFSPLAANALQAVSLSHWLTLNINERQKKTPFVYLEHDNSQKKTAISYDFAALIARQQQQQQVLLELAGIVTPFTDYVEQSVAQRLSDEHQAELNALTAEYEAKITAINAAHQQQAHNTVRNQLLTLAGYDIKHLQEH